MGTDSTFTFAAGSDCCIEFPPFLFIFANKVAAVISLTDWHWMKRDNTFHLNYESRVGKKANNMLHINVYIHIILYISGLKYWDFIILNIGNSPTYLVSECGGHQSPLRTKSTGAALHFLQHFFKASCLDLDFCVCLLPGVNIAKFGQTAFLFLPICGGRSSIPIGSCQGGLDGGTWPSTASAWFSPLFPVHITIPNDQAIDSLNVEYLYLDVLVDRLDRLKVAVALVTVEL